VCHVDQSSVYASPYFKIQIALCINFMHYTVRAGWVYGRRGNMAL